MEQEIKTIRPAFRTAAGRTEVPEPVQPNFTRRRFDIEWITDEEAIAYDHNSDGMYPLITNDRSLSPAEILAAHRRQPMIEKRFEQIETVHEIAPVFLKSEARIQAFFTCISSRCSFRLSLSVSCVWAMKREKIQQLPLYPEQRQCAHPTTEQILRLFSLAARNKLTKDDKTLQTFDVEFTDLQRQVLTLRSGKRVHVIKNLSA